MSRYKELEARVVAMKKQIESAPQDTPDEAIWSWIEEYDRLIIDLSGEFEEDDGSNISKIGI